MFDRSLDVRAVSHTGWRQPLTDFTFEVFEVHSHDLLVVLPAEDLHAMIEARVTDLALLARLVERWGHDPEAGPVRAGRLVGTATSALRDALRRQRRRRSV